MNLRLLSRRGFLKTTGFSSAGFMLSMTFPGAGLVGNVMAEAAPTMVGAAEINAYIQVAEDGTITIMSGSPEMGQGIKTSLPMIIAEELGAKWEDVVVVQSPVDTARFGRQSTGGSYTLYNNFKLMQIMGASAREMFLEAGALAMERPKAELKAADSRVIHELSGDYRTFAQLASLAMRQTVPDPELLIFKGRQDYTIIGTAKSQVDSLEIVTGRGDFGIDTRVPEMLFGAYVKSPAVGGRIVSANLDEIKKLPGIVDAYMVKGNGDVRELMDGVGIVGTSTWAVFKAGEQVKAIWDESSASKDSWTGFIKDAAALRGKAPLESVSHIGDAEAALADSANTIVSSSYEFPYVSHLCLEPMNCTAHYKVGKRGEQDRLEVWLPTQNAPRFQGVAERLYGLSPEQLELHVKRMGGSFGRRTSSEYVCEAIELSRRSGKPVKLTWSRQECLAHDYFRVGGMSHVSAALTPEGKLAGWKEHYIGMQQNGKPVTGSGMRDSDYPLNILKDLSASQTLLKMDTSAGPWRAPRSNTHAFVTQGFIHELSVAAGRDHGEFLLEMLGEPRWLEPGNVRSMNTGRARDVIERVMREAGWGRSLPSGHGLGLAFYFCHAAHIAEIVEVSVSATKQLRLHKVWAAVDVGPIVNMSGAISQVQGAIIDGYSTMVGQKITMENGRIQQSNFHEYPVLRIAAAPEIDVHFIQSDFESTGLGEPALPPLAPAVANAIFAASGERVRKMPLVELGYSV